MGGWGYGTSGQNLSCIPDTTVSPTPSNVVLAPLCTTILSQTLNKAPTTIFFQKTVYLLRNRNKFEDI